MVSYCLLSDRFPICLLESPLRPPDTLLIIAAPRQQIHADARTLLIAETSDVE
jgi:hypothetical protein